MSLVHEALQKAEREKLRKAGIAPSPPSPVVTAPSMIQPPTTQTQVPTPTVAPLGRESVAPEPAQTAAEPAKTTSFLLPGLIACVAVVAILAIVFLVSNAASALRQSKEVARAPVAATEPAHPQPAVQPAAQPSSPPSAPPAAAVAPDESKYKLSGIMTDPDGKFVAVLNGRIAYEGYYIDGATVKKIERDRVTIDDHGHDAVLRLF